MINLRKKINLKKRTVKTMELRKTSINLIKVKSCKTDI